jgi:DNA-binding MarR family transcriptional regulator
MGARNTPPIEAAVSKNRIPPRDGPYQSLSPAALARALINHVRARRHHLPDIAVEDPQWLMTLELFLATEEGRAVSVSSLCFASGVPSTTALRHIRQLEVQGIFKRISHPHDRRIRHVGLSDGARSRVARYLIAITSGEADEEPPPLRSAH